MLNEYLILTSIRPWKVSQSVKELKAPLNTFETKYLL